MREVQPRLITVNRWAREREMREVQPRLIAVNRWRCRARERGMREVQPRLIKICCQVTFAFLGDRQGEGEDSQNGCWC